jgi:hypothetical protein
MSAHDPIMFKPQRYPLAIRLGRCLGGHEKPKLIGGVMPCKRALARAVGGVAAIHGSQNFLPRHAYLNLTVKPFVSSKTSVNPLRVRHHQQKSSRRNQQDSGEEHARAEEAAPGAASDEDGDDGQDDPSNGYLDKRMQAKTPITVAATLRATIAPSTPAGLLPWRTRSPDGAAFCLQHGSLWRSGRRVWCRSVARLIHHHWLSS